MFGNGGTIVTNGDESNKNSNVQIIQPNRIVVRFNTKLWQFTKIKSTKYEMYVFTWKERNKIYSKKERLKFLLLLFFCIFINYE